MPELENDDVAVAPKRAVDAFRLLEKKFVLVALVALLHPLGYVVVAFFIWLWPRMRSRSDEKYAGLRILR